MISPMPRAVTTTSNTERYAIERQLVRKSMIELRIAVAYSSGGRNPTSTTSVVNDGSWMNGTYDAPMPTSMSSRGAENLIRSAIAVTATTAAAIASRLSAMCTGQCCQTPLFRECTEPRS